MKRKTTFLVVLGLLCFITPQVQAQDFAQAINDQLETLANQGDLLDQDTEWEMTSSHTSNASQVNHVYYRQKVYGIEINGSESSLHLLPNGEVLTEHNKFVLKSRHKVNGPTSPSITAVQAVEAVANQLNYTITEGITVLQAGSSLNQESLLSTGGISRTNIPAKLMFQLTEEGTLVLVWDLSIQELALENYWSVRVDAVSGQIIDQVNWMLQCTTTHDHSVHETVNYNSNLYDIPNYVAEEETAGGCNECYEVFAIPLESPYYGERTLEIDPSNNIASPFGWHDTNGVDGAEFTDTRGNNVDAFEDGDNVGFRPNPGSDLNFEGYPFDQNWTNSNQYESAAITNLFYWNNILHDVLYLYGLDEAAGNFQVNNYGNGGAGGDPVRAEGQKGQTCNAFFGTPPDGQQPTMQMFVCGNMDGDVDNLVIAHEFAHGISNRLTGGGNNTSCLFNGEQMGEGWSDYYGVIMTILPGATGADPRGVGTYLFGQGPDGDGIRAFPYSTDLAVNPQTYGDVASVGGAHAIGSIWATMIWEMTWALIDEHGLDDDIYNFTGDVNVDKGNVMSMALVTEGMKLQPCSPGFVDGRDAILAADQALYGGANFCLIWEAFAKRGLGLSADQGSSDNSTDGIEAFDSPSTQLDTGDEFCVSQGTQTLGGGAPLGGVYSGPGVTDDGNGETYTFDPADAGIGVHTISYEAESLCTTNSTATDTIEVVSDDPEIVCMDATVELDENGDATIEFSDVVGNLLPGDWVVDQTGTFAPITIGGTNVSLTDDDVSGALDIGFSFNFWDVDYTDFYISSNGFITFSSGSSNGCCSGDFIPSSGGPNNLIAMVWEDLNPNNGGNVSYETVGVAPDRILVVEFDGVPYFGSSNTVTSQIQLFETSNRIEIHSTQVPADGNSTQGIENSAGDAGFATPGRNSQVWDATNDYVAFYRDAGDPADNCGSTTTVSASQTSFDCSDLGTNTITITFEDENGNSSSCTATVTVEDPLGVCVLGIDDNVLNDQVTLSPNPTEGTVHIVNTGNESLVAATIIDVNGRILQYTDLSSMREEAMLSLERFATGIYFVKIDSPTQSLVKRIIKK